MHWCFMTYVMIRSDSHHEQKSNMNLTCNIILNEDKLNNFYYEKVKLFSTGLNCSFCT